MLLRYMSYFYISRNIDAAYHDGDKRLYKEARHHCSKVVVYIKRKINGHEKVQEMLLIYLIHHFIMR